MPHLDPGRITAVWRRTRALPAGGWLFSRWLGRRVPYTGGLRPRVLELEPGRARVALRERRALQNHLGGVHAAALLNLGEAACGLAMLTGLPPGLGGKVRGMSIEFAGKGRGELVAECAQAQPPPDARGPFDVRAEIRDAAGALVATTTVHWILEPAG